MTLKGYGKFWAKLNAPSQFSLLKSWKIPLKWARRSKFLTLLLIFFWKLNWLNLNVSQEFPVMTLKSYGKFGAKLNGASQFRLLKTWKISLERGRKSKFLILLVSFFWKLNWFRLKLSLEFPVMTPKGYGKFGAKLNGASQFSLLKSCKISLQWEGRSKFLTLLLIFFWNLNWLNLNLSQKFSVMILKGYGQFWAKLNAPSQFSLLKSWKIPLKWARRSKFRTLLLIFFLKGKLVQVETFTGVSCHDAEGLWTVWGKTECSFPIQPPEKLENFFGVGEKVKISNSIG